MPRQRSSFATLIGLETNKTSHLEKWVSATGGLVGILAVAIISRHYVDVHGAAWLVASMGASAVLVFAVPHGPLSQPWPVIGGHLVSAIIGVSCARWIPDILLAASVSVALAILAMHYLRCIHPPGGATALTAVIAGDSIHSLGYAYVITPALFNAITITAIAVAFNSVFPWRRYPTVFADRNRKTKPSARTSAQNDGDSLTHSDLKAALRAMNSTIDISERDLETVYRLAKNNSQSSSMDLADIGPARYYSNGRYGSNWQVRQIIDWEYPKKGGEGLVIYKVVAGENRRTTAKTSLDDFARWARYEVFLNENSWQRVKQLDAATEAI